MGFTGKLGGELVYEHGANVKIGGVLVKDTGGGEKGERGEGVAAPGDSSGKEAPSAMKPREQDDDEKK